MKRKLYLLILLTISILLIGISQKGRFTKYYATRGFLYWEDNIKFGPNYFNAQPDYNSNFNYYYYFGHYLDYNLPDKAIVKSFFDKNKSWLKDSKQFFENRDEEFIKTHFDLAEAYARIANRKLDSLLHHSNPSRSEVENITEEIYKMYYFNREKLNLEFENNEQYMFDIYSQRLDKVLNSDRIDNTALEGLFEEDINETSSIYYSPRFEGVYVKSNYMKNKISLPDTIDFHKKRFVDFLYKDGSKEQFEIKGHNNAGNVLKYKKYNKIHCSFGIKNDSTIIIDNVVYIKR